MALSDCDSEQPSRPASSSSSSGAAASGTSPQRDSTTSQRADGGLSASSSTTSLGEERSAQADASLAQQSRNSQPTRGCLVAYDGKVSPEAERVCRGFGLSPSGLELAGRPLQQIEQNARLIPLACDCCKEEPGNDRPLSAVQPYVCGTQLSSCLFTEDSRYLICGRVCRVQHPPRDHLLAIPLAGTQQNCPSNDAVSLRHDRPIPLCTRMVNTEDEREAAAIQAPQLGLLEDATIAYISRKAHDLIPLYLGPKCKLVSPPTLRKAAGGRCSVGTRDYTHTMQSQTLRQRQTYRSDPAKRSKLVLMMESGTAVSGAAVSVSVYDLAHKQQVTKLGQEAIHIMQHNVNVLGTKTMLFDSSGMPRVPISHYLCPPSHKSSPASRLPAFEAPTTLSKYTSAAFSPNSKLLIVSTHSVFIPSGLEECSVFILDLKKCEPPPPPPPSPADKFSPVEAGRGKVHFSTTVEMKYMMHTGGMELLNPGRTPVVEVSRLPALCVSSPDEDTSVCHVSCVFHPGYSLDQQRMYALPDLRDGTMKRRISGLDRGFGSLPRSRQAVAAYTSSPIARQRGLRRRSSFSDVEATSASLKRTLASTRTCGSVAVLSVMQRRFLLLPAMQWMRVLLLHVDSQTILWEKTRPVVDPCIMNVQMQFTPDGAQLAILLEVGRVDFHSTSDGTLLRTLRPSLINRLAPLSGIVISPDQRHIAGIADGKEVCTWTGSVASLKHLSHLAVTSLRLEISQRKQVSSASSSRRSSSEIMT